jgi:hypothetical protein
MRRVSLVGGLLSLLSQTWEVYCIELQAALCGCIYNPVFVGADAEKQVRVAEPSLT